MKISVSIIARNEEKNIKACLDSLSWADEIVLVDCESTDKTAEIAAQYKVKLFSKPNNENLNINKQFAIDQCSGDWIFYLDPDETIGPELKAELDTVLGKNVKESAFFVPRKNFYFGRWLKHGGKYPDVQLRFFQRGKAFFPCKDVHERLEIKGTIGRFNCAFNHYPYRDYADIVKKLNFYATLKAEKFAKQGRASELGPGRALRKFSLAYFVKLGFLDGPEGFAAAVIDLFNEVLAYIKSKEL